MGIGMRMGMEGRGGDEGGGDAAPVRSYRSAGRSRGQSRARLPNPAPGAPVWSPDTPNPGIPPTGTPTPSILPLGTPIPPGIPPPPGIPTPHTPCPPRSPSSQGAPSPFPSTAPPFPHFLPPPGMTLQATGHFALGVGRGFAPPFPIPLGKLAVTWEPGSGCERRKAGMGSVGGDHSYCFYRPPLCLALCF